MHSPLTALIAVSLVGWLLMALGWSLAIKHRRESRHWKSVAVAEFEAGKDDRRVHAEQRREWEEWKVGAIRAGYIPPIKNPAKVLRDIFARPVKRSDLPPFTYPPDLIVGTPAYPIVLDRTHVDSALNDTAVASTLADLVKDCGGRL